MKLSVRYIFLLTAVLAVLFGILVTFTNARWDRGHALLLSSFSITTVGAWFSVKWRKQLVAYALFGWSYFLYTQYNHTNGPNVVEMGFAIGIFTALAVSLIPTDRP